MEIGGAAAVLEIIGIVLAHEGVADAGKIDPGVAELVHEERSAIEQLAAVELLVDRKEVPPVALADSEAVDAPSFGPLPAALGEIIEGAFGGAVAILGVLGEELCGDIAERGRELRIDDGRGLGEAREVRVDDLHRVARGEGADAREDLVKHGAERVEIRAVVDLSVHPARLLGRDVREEIVDDVFVVDVLVLARDGGRGAEAGQLER